MLVRVVFSEKDLVRQRSDSGALTTRGYVPGTKIANRGHSRSLGHHGRVTSPTFTLASRYEDARVPISHLDLYRLRGAGPDPEELALLEDDLADDRVVFVEWPEALAPDGLARPIAARVVLRHAGGDRREVEVVR